MQFISNKKWDALQLTIKALQTSNLNQLTNNFTSKIFPSWNVVKEMDAYQTMDFIYAVVSKLATTSAMIPFYGFDKGKDTDLPESDPLVQFLNTLDFEEKEKLFTYLYLNGEVFALKNRPELGVNSAFVQSLTFLHPAKMQIKISGEFPVQIVGYKYFDLNSRVDKDIELDDIIFIKLFNPSANQHDEFRGLSPVKVLTRTLTRVTAGEDATVSQLQNGGTPGIVYDETPGLAPEAIGQRKDNFGRFLRNSANKGAPYFSANKLGYIQLGTPLTDMEVIALADVDFDRVCNVFGVSSILFNNKSASTESNVQQMVKEMYTNTVLPNIYRVEAALNKGVVPFIKTKGIIKCDTSEIKALQEDQNQLVTALAAAWWLTPNEKRTAQMYDQDENELFDKYIIPSGLMLLDDLEMPVEDVENTAGDYVPQLDANGKPIKQPRVVPLRQANG